MRAYVRRQSSHVKPRHCHGCWGWRGDGKSLRAASRVGRSAATASSMLLDLKFPKLDGFEALQRIRTDARTRRLPVVMLTSSKEEQDLVRSYDREASSYIHKPVDFDQLIEAVRQPGLYWLVLNESPLQ